MSLWIVLIIIQILALIVFAPIKIGVKLYFSLNKETSIILCKVFGINILRIRLHNIENHIVLTLNGKNLTNKFVTSEMLNLGKLPKLIKYLTNEKLINFAYALGLVGGDDAMNCALTMGVMNILWGAQKQSKHSKKGQFWLMPDFNTNRLDFDLLAHIKINLYQIGEILTFISK